MVFSVCCRFYIRLNISVVSVGDGGLYEFEGKSACLHSVLRFRAAKCSLTVCFKRGFSSCP